MFNDLISLFYPITCIGCDVRLTDTEKILCTFCLDDLPITNDHKNKENSLKEHFVYDERIISAQSFLFFRKGGVAQKLIHALKYEGKKEVGSFLGNLYASYLDINDKNTIITPIPLHPSRQKKRGYNQSSHIAKGIATATNIPIREDLIRRIQKNKSQTKRSKLERWENVKNIFSPCSEKLSGLSVVLVDDVITTGATMGMLCDRLIEADVGAIHLVSLARGE